MSAPPGSEASAPTLADLRATLLRDADGDGFPDALRGPAWIALGGGAADVDAAVAAAAEFLAPLAARALVLPVEARAWRVADLAFCIGPAIPPTDLDAAAAGAVGAFAIPHGGRLLWLADGVAITARDGPSLIAAVLAWLADIVDDPRPARAARVPTAEPTAASGTGSAPSGLGRLLRGAGTTPPPGAAFSGATDQPDRFVGGFAPSGGAPEALAVALRLALAGTGTPARVTAPRREAAVHSVTDASLPAGGWAVRSTTRAGRPCVEVAGHDPSALAAACSWFASVFPRLPDGVRLEDVEQGLTRFVRGATRAGRLAAAAGAAGAARMGGSRPTTAELPYPPAGAAQVLGMPVRNSARDGALQRWSMTAAWEGDRLLEAAASAFATPGGHVERSTIEAYASETLAVREGLRGRLVNLVEEAGAQADVLPVRHAFRPALHWLVEEVAPAAPPATATLRVRASRQPDALGATDRWLRELYPVAELIEASWPGIRVDVALGETADTPLYEAAFVAADGSVLGVRTLAPPTADSALPAGGHTLVTTAGVRLWRGGRAAATVTVPTDAETFWSWFMHTVVPALTPTLERDESPLLHEIAVVAELSEPDDLLPLDHETDSVLETLHEDVYFGLLEAVDRALGAEAPRVTSPGRILPFFRGRAGAPTRAQVIVRARGSERVGVRGADGTWRDAPHCGAQVDVAEVHGRGACVESIVLQVTGLEGDAAEALGRLAWARLAMREVLPGGIRVRARGPGASDVDLGSHPLPPAPPPLPDRPLHPREAHAHARWWASRQSSVRFATPRETRLGQPLDVVEIASPPHPATSRARCSAWKPTILVSARQHANEATSTPAAFAWLDRWLADAALWRRANLVLHPLENPDGARLHAALCALAPAHMHHAARYTAFGADLQTNPVIGGETIAESLMRSDAAARWDPVAHLNDHGYPAHAWIRSQTGFLPRGFEDWSLPTGHLTILTTHGPDESAGAALRDGLAARVERALHGDAGVRAHTGSQVRRSLRYRPAASAPFTFRSELPFLLHHRPTPTHATDPAYAGEPADGRARNPTPTPLRPALTLITEVPDETVAGEAWHRCVRTHLAVNDAVTRGLLAWLDLGEPVPERSG